MVAYMVVAESTQKVGAMEKANSVEGKGKDPMEVEGKGKGTTPVEVSNDEDEW